MVPSEIFSDEKEGVNLLLKPKKYKKVKIHPLTFEKLKTLKKMGLGKNHEILHKAVSDLLNRLCGEEDLEVAELEFTFIPDDKLVDKIVDKRCWEDTGYNEEF